MVCLDGALAYLKGGSNYYCLDEWYAWMLQWLFSRLAPAMNLWSRTNNIHMLWDIWNEKQSAHGMIPNMTCALGGSLSQLTWMKLDRYITIYCYGSICHGALNGIMVICDAIVVAWFLAKEPLINLSVEKWGSQLGPRSLGLNDWKLWLWAVIQSHVKWGLDYMLLQSDSIAWGDELNEQDIPWASWSRATGHGRQAMNVMD